MLISSLLHFKTPLKLVILRNALYNTFNAQPFWTLCFALRNWLHTSLIRVTVRECLFDNAMSWCIAYGCDNTTHKSLPGVSFHRLPLNNPPLLKQVYILYQLVREIT